MDTNRYSPPCSDLFFLFFIYPCSGGPSAGGAGSAGTGFGGGFASCNNVIESPFTNIRPTSCRVLPISTASSNTIFMYSSKPIICPSIWVFVSSYNQRRTLVFFYKYKITRIRLKGIFCKKEKDERMRSIVSRKQRRKEKTNTSPPPVPSPLLCIVYEGQ